MDFHGFSCYIAVYHGMYQNGICHPPHEKVPWHVPLRHLLLRDPIDISRNILIILQHVMICDICDDPVANDLANRSSWNIPVSPEFPELPELPYWPCRSEFCVCVPGSPGSRSQLLLRSAVWTHPNTMTWPWQYNGSKKIWQMRMTWPCGACGMCSLYSYI